MRLCRRDVEPAWSLAWAWSWSWVIRYLQSRVTHWGLTLTMFLVVVMMVMILMVMILLVMIVLIMIHYIPSQITHSLRTGPLCPSLSQPIMYTKTSKWLMQKSRLILIWLALLDRPILLQWPAESIKIKVGARFLPTRRALWPRMSIKISQVISSTHSGVLSMQSSITQHYQDPWRTI